MSFGKLLVSHDSSQVLTLDGEQVAYLDADYAATSRSFLVVKEAVDLFLKSYGSVHRGSGQLSRTSTQAYEQAFDIISEFIGDDPQNPTYNLIPTNNTTHAVNMLTALLRRNLPGHHPNGVDHFFVPLAEHSANDLPWRRAQLEANEFSPVTRIMTDGNGMIDLADLERKISDARGEEPYPEYTGLLTFTGASSITGAIADVKKITEIAKKYNVLTFMDAAQLVAHREIELEALGLDFAAFAGHKMYAPYGGGVLVGRREIVKDWQPAMVGGGTITFASKDDQYDSPNFRKRFGAGTPNAMGFVAMAAAAHHLKHGIGYDRIIEHEQALLNRAQQEFASLPESLRLVAPMDFDASNKSAVFSFDVGDISPNLFAARLANEFGIGVRQGPICQYELVAHLLNKGPYAASQQVMDIRAGNSSEPYGIVRASFGIDSSPEEISRFAHAIKQVVATADRANEYVQKGSAYVPINEIKGQSAANVFEQLGMDISNRSGLKR